mgnify:FL=1
MGTREQRRHGRRRQRRRNYTPLLVLLLVVIAACALLLNSCGKDEGSAQVDAGAGNVTDSGGGETEQNGGGENQESDASIPPEEQDPMEGYTVKTMTEEDMQVGLQILVSNEHTYSFPEAAESQLVNLVENKSNSYSSSLNTTLILPVTVEHLNDMLDDYLAQGGATDIMVVSGYRTYEYQQGLFDRNAAKNGIENAKRFVAQAGGSEHHTGYAVDLYSNNNGDYFEGVGEYKWVTDHCHEYGFILRYTEEKEPVTKIGPESWHFRYVGVPHSYIIVDNDFCLEEYIDYLRQFPFDGEHLTYTVGDQEYEIYYVEGLEVPVPESGNYTVSGNNVDGFIVTIEK